MGRPARLSPMGVVAFATLSLLSPAQAGNDPIDDAERTSVYGVAAGEAR